MTLETWENVLAGGVIYKQAIGPVQSYKHAHPAGARRSSVYRYHLARQSKIDGVGHPAL